MNDNLQTHRIQPKWTHKHNSNIGHLWEQEELDCDKIFGSEFWMEGSEMQIRSQARFEQDKTSLTLTPNG